MTAEVKGKHLKTGWEEVGRGWVKERANSCVRVWAGRKWLGSLEGKGMPEWLEQNGQTRDAAVESEGA